MYRYSYFYSCQMIMKLEFFDRFSKKKAPISNFVEIHPVEAEFFRADRGTDEGTDMTKSIFGFRNFAKVPKSVIKYTYNVRLFVICV